MTKLGMYGRAVALIIVAMTTTTTAHAEAPGEIPVQGLLTNSAGVPLNGESVVVFAIYNTEIGGAPLYSESQRVLTEQGFFTAYLGQTSPLDLTMFRDQSSLYLGVRVDSDPEMSPRIAFGTTPFAAFASYAGDAETLGGLDSSEFAPASHTHPMTEITGIPHDLLDGDDDTTYNAGMGLQLLSGNTMAVDPSTTQLRVNGSCPGGEAVVGIQESGDVICSPVASGGIDGVTAGFGLVGGGSSGTVTLAIAVNGINATHLAASSVGASEIATNAVGASEIASSAVGSSEIATNAVGSSEIATNAVGASEIASSAVGSSEINTTQVQRRVTGTCPSGQAIYAVSSTGTVSCRSVGGSTSYLTCVEKYTQQAIAGRNGFAVDTPSCSTGYRRTGGGCRIMDYVSKEHIYLTSNRPYGTYQWRCAGFNGRSGDTITVKAQAICCKVN